MLTLIFALGTAAALPSLAPPERTLSDNVRAAPMAAHTRYLADDLLEGRAPGSNGSALAMRYVAAAFERLALKPLGDDGGYVQKFDMVGLRTVISAPPVLTGKNGALALKPGIDSVVAAGRQTPDEHVKDAELVFVGYGITAPKYNWDDFKSTDVRGKILVVMNNHPEGDPKLFEGKTRLYFGRWSYKYEEAARRGAAGVIIIHTTQSAGYPWQVVQTSWGAERFELPANASDPNVKLRMWATEETARALAKLGGHDLDALRARAETRDFQPVPLGVKLTVDIKTSLRKLATGNVLGVLPGSDPKLASEYVVYTAHHDHLGRGVSKNGDDIYNGALDNAAGVAQMLAIAEAFAQSGKAPKRSILFAAVGAEESGLLGSQYLCDKPPVPAEKLVANLNIDGINIWGKTRDLAYVGLGRSSLDEVVTRVAAAQGRKVIGDPMPDRGHFYRSDQYNFARIGVPAVYLEHGLDYVGKPPGWGKERTEIYERTNYHQPSDHIDATWNFDGAVDDGRLLAIIGRRIADTVARPAWKEGDEFAKK